MPEFTEKQKKRLERIAELIQLGPIALAKYLFDLEEKIDEEIPAITNLMDRIKGDPGHTPVLGVDYYTKEERQNLVDAIYSLIEIPIPKDGTTPVAGVDYPTKKQLADYIDAKLAQRPPVRDGYTPQKGFDYFTDDDIKLIALDVLSQIPPPPVLTGEDFVDEINDLPTDDEEKKIDAKHIKNLPERIVQNIFDNGGPGAPFETIIKDSNGVPVPKDTSGAYILPVNAEGGGYSAPAFATFTITGQAQKVELGTTISGSKSFAWTFTNGVNVEPDTMDIIDVTGVTNLATNISIVSPSSQNVGSIQRLTPGAYSWRGAADNTNGATFQSPLFTVDWCSKMYIGKNAAQTLNEAQIEALSDFAALATTFAGTYVLSAGGYGFFAWDDALGSPAAFTGFKDATTGLNLDMADNITNSFFDHEENGWWYALVNVTNAQGVTRPCRVYRTTYSLGGEVQAILS